MKGLNLEGPGLSGSTELTTSPVQEEAGIAGRSVSRTESRGQFDMQTFGLQVAEVMGGVLPELDPTPRAVYLALFWRAYGNGQPWCEVSQEALAAECRVTRKTVKAALRELAIARLVTVEEAGTKSHATRYRVHLAREAGIRRYWEVPSAWRAALRGSEAPLLLDQLDPEDQSLVEGMYEGLGQGERDRLLQEAVRILRARGWRRPELAGEDLERMMKELLLTRSFGPERLRKYREGMEAQVASEDYPKAPVSAASSAR